jgi:hypothetical protein
MSLNMHAAAVLTNGRKNVTKNKAKRKVVIITSDHKPVFGKYQAPTLIRV